MTSVTESSKPSRPPLSVAVIGAGPVGLSLGLHAARELPHARVSVFDARPLDKDVSGDPRTLAMSLGSVQLLQRLNAWDAQAAQAIVEVHVSQQPPTLSAAAQVHIRAIDEAVPQLGAVLRYGQIVKPLQAAWMAAAQAAPTRLISRFGTPVAALKPTPQGVEVDAGIVDQVDLAIVAEGGVFGAARGEGVAPASAERWRHDYGQTAWVGTVDLEGARPGVAFERFTRQGPAALLPLPHGQAALVWCVDARDDPVADLDDAQRLLVLNTMFPREAGRIVRVSDLKSFSLGLDVRRTLVEGRVVRIGNAAQTLHPVAGQGLNLGLRDAFELVRALRASPNDMSLALRSFERRRAPDRWAMIGATDFLARSFTWSLPGLGIARGLGLAALQAFAPAKSLLAREMMFGWR